MNSSTIAPKLSLSKFSVACINPACNRAVLIASTAHSAADALLNAYEVKRHIRGRHAGMTTDNEQDLLRSMLVMAAAGLDATVKQLIEDTLALLIAVDKRAQNTFEKFVLRRVLGGDSSGASPGINSKLLAAALISPNPQKRLIDDYVEHLTGSSLQSVDSLFEVAAALGAEPMAIGLTQSDLRPIFDTRNKIIHELDINLDAKRRTRNVRTQSAMIDSTERLFALVQALISSVDGRLNRKT